MATVAKLEPREGLGVVPGMPESQGSREMVVAACRDRVAEGSGPLPCPEG